MTVAVLGVVLNNVTVRDARADRVTESDELDVIVVVLENAGLALNELLAVAETVGVTVTVAAPVADVDALAETVNVADAVNEPVNVTEKRY